VTKRTQVLIVGELGWPLLDNGRPSNKLSRATVLGIPIVSELASKDATTKSRDSLLTGPRERTAAEPSGAFVDLFFA
jgi:hypothetical protein